MKHLDLPSKQFDNIAKLNAQSSNSARTAGLSSSRSTLSSKKQENSPILYNPNFSHKTPRGKMKIATNLDFHFPVKLDDPLKTLGNGFGLSINTKPNSHRPQSPQIHPSEPKAIKKEDLISPKTRKITSSELTMIKGPSLNIKSISSLHPQKPALRIPVHDLYEEPEIKPRKSSTVNNLDDQLKKTSTQSPHNPQFDNSEENQNDMCNKLKRKPTLCSTMESSTQIHQTKVSSLLHLNSSSSPNEKAKALEASKTLKDFGFQTAFHSPRGNPSKTFRKQVKVRHVSKKSDLGPVVTKPQSSWAIHKITDAFEKAKLYNDQVILQYQFDKQNEEEERDFCELYEMLNSNI